MTLPFDAYSLRARLFPALIAIAPAMALVSTLVTWDRLHLSQVFATLALSVLMFAFADVARRQGIRVQKKLYPNGLPTKRLLKHNKRVLEFVTGKIGSNQPDAGVKWLRDHMRNPTDFKLVLEENITYGFRRNLLGLKWIGLALNVVTVCIAAVLAFFQRQAEPQTEMTAFILIFVVAGLHALYFLSAVTKASVKQAAETYAHQLLASAELLIDQK